ncbi:MAG: S9 family peptidase, partial [Gemmatimonadota bacterium]
MNRLPRSLGTARIGAALRVSIFAVFLLASTLGPSGSAANAQMVDHAMAADHHTANYDLAARWAPYKLRSLLHTTLVNPRWIEGGEKFWYDWEDTNGKTFYIVDPTAGSKRAVFDNDRIAAELTRITQDPYDGQHLPITSIRFIDENTIQFDVTSSQDEEEEEAEVQEEEEQQEEQQQGE